MPSAQFTIGRLARAAGVNIETIRHYQRLRLLPRPPSVRGTFRVYPRELAERVRFIKRAQELGFSLREIAGLLELQDGANRSSVRRIAGDRLTQIRTKLKDLKRMERALAHLIEQCARSRGTHRCPIIEAIAHAAPTLD